LTRRPGAPVGAPITAGVGSRAARLGIRCPIRAVFGIDCPGCGGTRALLALMRGDVPQAARENVAAVLTGLAAAGYLVTSSRTVRAAATVRVAAARHQRARSA
jgi:uncharacterized protein DUF2752